MQNDIQSTAETYISLHEAADLFPRKAGKKTPYLTMKRWIVGGYRGIRLDGLKMGNTWFTTAAAVARFQAACTTRAIGAEPAPSVSAKLDLMQSMDRLRRRGLKQIEVKV